MADVSAAARTARLRALLAERISSSRGHGGTYLQRGAIYGRPPGPSAARRTGRQRAPGSHRPDVGSATAAGYPAAGRSSSRRTRSAARDRPHRVRTRGEGQRDQRHGRADSRARTWPRSRLPTIRLRRRSMGTGHEDHLGDRRASPSIRCAAATPSRTGRGSSREASTCLYMEAPAGQNST